MWSQEVAIYDAGPDIELDEPSHSAYPGCNPSVGSQHVQMVNTRVEYCPNTSKQAAVRLIEGDEHVNTC